MSPINLSSKANVGPHRSRVAFVRSNSLPAQLSTSKPSSSCSSSKRRRGTQGTSRTPRRRHCPRPDCITYVNGPNAFDKLPWISQVESEPTETANVWDIADLSLLPDPPSSGVGPVRNRRTSASSRSGATPFGGTVAEAQNAGSLSSSFRSRPQSLPLELLPAADSEALEPHTPPGVSYNPYEATFVDLMPVFVPNRNGCRTPPRPRPWADDSSPLLPSPM